MARKRSELAHNQVIEAAAALFAERGIETTSMDAIAKAAGVSKATIYRHWPDKDSLCLEVLVYLHGLDKELPDFDSLGDSARNFAGGLAGDSRAGRSAFRRDLVAQLTYDPAADRKAMRERILPHLVAYASHNLVFGQAWRARVITPVRVALRNTIDRGKQRGILRADLDPEVGLALLIGPLIYRNIFVLKNGGPAPQNLEAHVADSFLAGFAVR
jgi:AcrR family transcriptional regulator